jgi:short-subunit dehydrogenase
VKAFLPYLLENPNGGHIMNVSSAGAVAVDAIKRNALYATTHPLIADYVEMRAAKLIEAFRHPIPKTEPLPAE